LRKRIAQEEVEETFQKAAAVEEVVEEIVELPIPVVEAQPAQPSYPEHEKLQRISDKSQSIGEFVDWLNTQGIFLAEWVKKPGRQGSSDLTYARKGIQELLAMFFDIDQKKISEEKQAILQLIRERGL
jgi:hypothetical protein